jgi:hypothetical protein
MDYEIDPIFEQAIDTMMDGRYDEFKAVLHQYPHFVHTQSAFGHRASLIHYIAANGVDTDRLPHTMEKICWLCFWKKGLT